MKFLAIANGALWLHGGPQGPRQIESRFAREVMEREAQSRRTTAWKHEQREARQGMLAGASLWGGGPGQQALAPARFLHVCPAGEPDTFHYLLSFANSVGLFRYHAAEDREVRLFHQSKAAVLGMDWEPASRRLVLACANPDGTAQLEVFDEEGNRKGAITGGDCIDAAPAIVPGAASTVVYQSTGVARHPDSGHVVAHGHATICRVNYATGQLDTLLDDRRYDYLLPRVDANGVLYAIRRPSEKAAHERAGSALKDTLLIPWRLAKAVFGYLNFFSMVYGKEPLRSAGPRRPELDQDLGKIWLHGRMIELSRVKADPQHGGHLVPASWELVCQAPGQPLRVLASHAAGYDLAPDGTVLHTNGFDVLALREDGGSRKLARQELVQGVAWA